MLHKKICFVFFIANCILTETILFQTHLYLNTAKCYSFYYNIKLLAKNKVLNILQFDLTISIIVCSIVLRR